MYGFPVKGTFELRRIIFDEDQRDSLPRMAEELFDDPSDPRSFSYERILIRPFVDWPRIAEKIFIPVLIAGCLYAFLRFLTGNHILSLLFSLLSILLYASVNAKKIAICTIQIYQRYAPESVRNKCRFEPSCSQYMILAIEKYGLLRGLSKGIHRIKRCNVNGGGYDFP